MKSIQAILTLDMENLPANFADILKLEQEVVSQWKDEGVLEHLFLRETKNGAVLVFKGLDLAQAQARMETLPFFALKKSVEYLSLIKQF
jgi:muconolactone D-isomerase